MLGIDPVQEQRTSRSAGFSRLGAQAIIEHSENVAFDPRPGSSSDFYVLTGSLRLFSTFKAVSSIAILSGGGTVAGEAVTG